RRYGSRYVGIPSLDPETVLVNFVLTCCGVLVRRQVFEEVGFFDESLRGCEDLDMWLRIVENFPILFVPVDGFLYRQHGQQATKSADVLWADGKRVVGRAQARYPYSRAAIRRKMGVLCYRLSEHAMRQRQLWHGAAHLAQAACWDPGRALGELGRRLLPYGATASGG